MTVPYKYDSEGVKPPRDHMSRQFTYVIHGSQNKVPVHEIPDKQYPAVPMHSITNIHRSSFHAGTPQAAADKVSWKSDTTYAHVYRIDRDTIDPLMWKDTLDYENPPFQKRLRGIQPMLSESVEYRSGMIAENAESKAPKAIPYRNMGEDYGSTSFIIPKNIVGKGVKYLGTVKKTINHKGEWK